MVAEKGHKHRRQNLLLLQHLTQEGEFHLVLTAILTRIVWFIVLCICIVFITVCLVCSCFCVLFNVLLLLLLLLL